MKWLVSRPVTLLVLPVSWSCLLNQQRNCSSLERCVVFTPPVDEDAAGRDDIADNFQIREHVVWSNGGRNPESAFIDLPHLPDLSAFLKVVRLVDADSI